MSTEQNKTPFQLWTQGFYNNAYSNQQAVRIALEDPIVDLMNYGVDDNGPCPKLQTNNHITVPQSTIQLSEEQKAVLLLVINPLENDQNYGIDIYNNAVQMITEVTGQ